MEKKIDIVPKLIDFDFKKFENKLMEKDFISSFDYSPIVEIHQNSLSKFVAEVCERFVNNSPEFDEFHPEKINLFSEQLWNKKISYSGIYLGSIITQIRQEDFSVMATMKFHPAKNYLNSFSSNSHQKN